MYFQCTQCNAHCSIQTMITSRQKTKVCNSLLLELCDSNKMMLILSNKSCLHFLNTSFSIDCCFQLLLYAYSNNTSTKRVSDFLSSFYCTYLLPEMPTLHILTPPIIASPTITATDGHLCLLLHILFYVNLTSLRILR